MDVYRNLRLFCAVDESVVEDGVLAIADGLIAYAGPAEGAPAVNGGQETDLKVVRVIKVCG